MKDIFVGIFLLFITGHAQARDIVSVKFDVPYFEYGYIPSRFLNEPLYACVQATLQPGEFLGFWIDFAEHSVLSQSYETWELLCTKTFLRYKIMSSCFVILDPQQRFTMYLNATTDFRIGPNEPTSVEVFHGVYVGDIIEFEGSELNEKIWPDPYRQPGYIQSDFQCTDVYYIAANHVVYIRYNINYIPGYIHKLTVQEDGQEYPLSNWEQDSPKYIVNKELTTNRPSVIQFTVSKNSYIRIFYYTFARSEILTPITMNYKVTVSTHRNFNDELNDQTSEVIIKPFKRRYSTSILCPRY